MKKNYVILILNTLIALIFILYLILYSNKRSTDISLSLIIGVLLMGVFSSIQEIKNNKKNSSVDKSKK